MRQGTRQVGQRHRRIADRHEATLPPGHARAEELGEPASGKHHVDDPHRPFAPFSVEHGHAKPSRPQCLGQSRRSGGQEDANRRASDPQPVGCRQPQVLAQRKPQGIGHHAYRVVEAGEHNRCGDDEQYRLPEANQRRESAAGLNDHRDSHSSDTDTDRSQGNDAQGKGQTFRVHGRPPTSVLGRQERERKDGRP